jgi:Flp pilus assembly protein TadG
MVEFALVIPIFMLVLSGILDFGMALYSRMTVINAAREGARAAVMVPDYTTIPGVAQTAAVAAAKQAGLTVTVDTGTGKDVKCIPTRLTSPPATCAFTKTTGGAPTDAVPGDSVSVTIHYTYHTFFPAAFGATIDLTSTVQMVIE